MFRFSILHLKVGVFNNVQVAKLCAAGLFEEDLSNFSYAYFAMCCIYLIEVVQLMQHALTISQRCNVWIIHAKTFLLFLLFIIICLLRFIVTYESAVFLGTTQFIHWCWYLSAFTDCCCGTCEYLSQTNSANSRIQFGHWLAIFQYLRVSVCMCVWENVYCMISIIVLIVEKVVFSQYTRHLNVVLFGHRVQHV